MERKRKANASRIHVHVTIPLAANLQPHHQTPLSTALPTSVHAHVNHKHPQTGRHLVLQASAPCPPARSPKPTLPVSSQSLLGHAKTCPGFNALLTFSTSRAKLPRPFARSTSRSASLVCAIFSLSSVVLPFTSGSNAVVQAAASLSLIPPFATASTKATPSVSGGRDASSTTASFGDLRRDGGSRIR